MAVVIAVTLTGCSLGPLAPQSETRATLDGLRRDEDTDKFARAFEPREFNFPVDHGPHDDFQTEWWYYTGNVFAPDGRRFGYQFTIFRRALIPPDEQAAVLARPSDLAFTQLYFAHFAVTDTGANEHVSFEKYSRSAAGLAGAQSPPFRVFIEDWTVETTQGENGGAEAVRVVAHDSGYAIDLNLTMGKPIVLHGDRGLSQKSNVPGNASYYYSMTRMTTHGKVTTPQGSFDVRGESWLDREWSTSALDENTAGWDWFALQFDDNRELMFYQLRLKDGASADVSKGTLVKVDGTSELLKRDDVRLTVLDHWTSPDSGATYPVKWRVVAPKYGLDIEVAPRVNDQEMKLSQRYWEGAVTINGSANGKSISGVGYLELTGYGESKTPER
jgi:predicted secreted hydrolase